MSGGLIGLKFLDGSIEGCYVHLDGHKLYSRLSSYIHSGQTTTALALDIIKAQSAGGLLEFRKDHTSWRFDKLENRNISEPYIISEKNWNENHLGVLTQYKVLVHYQTHDITTGNL